MRKSKFLLPLIGLTTLAGTTTPLVGCKDKNNEPKEPKTPLCFTNASNDNETIDLSYEANGLTVGDHEEDIDIEYTKTPNNKKSWQNWKLQDNSNRGEILPLHDGESIYIRNTKNTLSKNWNSQFFQFIIPGKVNASGNVDSMINYSELTPFCFARLFSNFSGYIVGLFKAPILPKKKLANGCYRLMFYGCNITQTPELPATELAPDCYRQMFDSCGSLTTATELTATTLAEGCYNGMFNQTKIRIPPSLPATTLAESCYESMFCYCHSLIQAPELPAGALTDRCYYKMFKDCRQLLVTEKTNNSLNKEEKIFTCPATAGFDNPVTEMFDGVGGDFEGKTPSVGNTYYWYNSQN